VNAMTQPAYDLRHETGPGRCAWCWQPLPTAESHAVVSAVRAPPLELRLHHKCWQVYRGLSGIEGAELRALYREWTPQRIEALRLHAGLTLVQLAARLKVSVERLRGVLGAEGHLGQKPTARLRGIAVDTRFERAEQAGEIDWSDRRAVRSLCMHCGWNAAALAGRLDVRDNTVTAWWDKGCPKLSVRHWARLNALARQHHFDAGMLMTDHLWTTELCRGAVEKSGVTQAAFAALAGCHWATVRDAIQGRRRVNRAMAYYFSRAALRLSLRLPPEGRIEPKRRAPRPGPRRPDE